MATIKAHQMHLATLKQDVKIKWLAACDADGIDPSSDFVVLSDTWPAREYNDAMAAYLKARNEYQRQVERNRQRRARHEAMTSLGLQRVKGALGGTYYE